MTQISTRDGRENATRNQSPLARINPSTKSHSNLYARYFLHGSDYKCHKAKPHQQCSKEQSLKNIKKKKRRKTTYKLEFNKIMEGEEYSASPPPPPAATKIESLACPEVLQNPRKKKKNKRRFSEEQIRSLESMFESETKLEPRKKVQLARELGLQPRQIAIWFQNRRARWKSKQIEQNYRVLKANYDSLLSRFESLKKEKQSLLKQLKMLGDLLEKTHDQGGKSKDLGGNSTSGDSDSGEPSCLKKGSDRGAVADSDGDEGGSGKNIQQEATENMGVQVDGSLALPEKSCNFESSSLFDGNSTWWDFWT